MIWRQKLGLPDLSAQKRVVTLAFLHLGKTAGTQIKLVLDQLAGPEFRTKIYGHGKTLSDIPDGIPYFFSIRQPVSRFVSGFYERRRQGGAMYPNPWSPFEAVAFGHFEHANDLAEELFSEGKTGRHAREAILSISHTARRQADHFARQGSFLNEKPPVAIVRQEVFERDMRWLLDKFEIELPLESFLARSRPKVRVTDYTGIPELSRRARENIENWYINDMWFYRDCENWIVEQTR